MVFEATSKIAGSFRVERTPPLARGLLRKVRKHSLARPHHTHVGRSVGILHKVVARRAFVIGLVARIGQVGDMQVRDDDRVQMLGLQVLNHLVEVRKALRVHGEGPVLLLIVDVQPDHVRRNLLAA